jgi:hypothetical protein
VISLEKILQILPLSFAVAYIDSYNIRIGTFREVIIRKEGRQWADTLPRATLFRATLFRATLFRAAILLPVFPRMISTWTRISNG